MLPKLRREYCEYIPRFLIVNTRKQHEINFVLPISLRQMEGRIKGKLIRAYGST